MKKRHIFGVMFFTTFFLMTAFFSLIFIHESIIINSVSVSAFIPSIQQFYGKINLPNGSGAGEGVLVELKYNNTIKASVYTNNSLYGYNPLVVVEDLEDGDLINFYLNSVKVAEYNFSSFGFTNLNLTMAEVCGDRYCSGNENCQNCPDDCGVCSNNVEKSSGAGSGGGGGGGGGGGLHNQNINKNISQNNTAIAVGQEENNNTPPKAAGIPENTGSQGLTGFSILNEISNEKVYVPLIITLTVLIIFMLLLITWFRKRHLVEELRIIVEKRRKALSINA